MTPVRATWLVAGRELRETTRRKSFWAVVAVLVLGATAGVVIPTVVANDTTKYKVVVVGDRSAIGPALVTAVEALDASVRIRPAADVDAARRAVREGDADIGIVVAERSRLIVKVDKDEALLSAAAQSLSAVSLAEGLTAAGVTPKQMSAALSQPAPTVEEVDPGTLERTAAAFAISLVLYILLLTLMVQAANGTAVEKSNRISEVLIPIVRPGPLLFGKVIGISLAGLITFGAAIVPVVVTLAVGGDLPAGLGGALVGGGLWFVLGMVLYLTISGALGALAERQEEAGVVVAPLTFVMIGTFFVTQSAADSTLGAVLAYVPLSSPLMLPARLARGVSSPFEIVASAVLLVIAVVLAVRFGSMVYGRAIVRTGRRLKLKDVLRPPRADGRSDAS